MNSSNPLVASAPSGRDLPQRAARVSPSSPPVLEAGELRKDYPGDGEAVHALRGVSLRVHRGEFICIMGASGSGKSTLLHLLAGLDQPSGGSIVVEGHNLAAMGDRERTLFRRRRLGMVFQAYNLLPTFTALENVCLPAMLDGWGQDELERKAREVLAMVDLEHRVKHRPQALSGGEQQRVAIARSLMNDPALILADEPTGNLDTHHATEVWRLLKSLVRDRGRTVVVVTHEAEGAAFSDRVIVLRDGLCVGEFEPDGDHDATAVATRYHQLVG